MFSCSLDQVIVFAFAAEKGQMSGFLFGPMEDWVVGKLEPIDFSINARTKSKSLGGAFECKISLDNDQNVSGYVATSPVYDPSAYSPPSPSYFPSSPTSQALSQLPVVLDQNLSYMELCESEEAQQQQQQQHVEVFPADGKNLKTPKLSKANNSSNTMSSDLESDFEQVYVPRMIEHSEPLSSKFAFQFDSEPIAMPLLTLPPQVSTFTFDVSLLSTCLDDRHRWNPNKVTRALVEHAKLCDRTFLLDVAFVDQIPAFMTNANIHLAFDAALKNQLSMLLENFRAEHCQESPPVDSPLGQMQSATILFDARKGLSVWPRVFGVAAIPLHLVTSKMPESANKTQSGKWNKGNHDRNKGNGNQQNQENKCTLTVGLTCRSWTPDRTRASYLSQLTAMAATLSITDPLQIPLLSKAAFSLSIKKRPQFKLCSDSLALHPLVQAHGQDTDKFSDFGWRAFHGKYNELVLFIGRFVTPKRDLSFKTHNRFLLGQADLLGPCFGLDFTQLEKSEVALFAELSFNQRERGKRNDSKIPQVHRKQRSRKGKGNSTKE